MMRSTMSMQTVAVMGWYNKENCGDESYKLAFPKIFPDYNFVFTADLSKEIINNSDAFILGGGDVMSDYYLDQLFGISKKKHVFSVSASENINPAKLDKFESLYVRDKKSVEILKQKGVIAKFVPDFAFMLEGDRARGRRLVQKIFIDEHRDLYEKIVVIVVNGFLANDESNSYNVKEFVHFHSLAYDLAHLLDSINASFLFVPFGQDMPYDDRNTNMWVASKCKYWKKNAVILHEPSVQNILDIFSYADAVISTRLHSTIFSCVTMTPYIDILHNHKNRWLAETIDKSDWTIPYEAFDENRAKYLLNRFLWSGVETTKNDLKVLLNKQRVLIKGLADALHLV